MQTHNSQFENAEQLDILLDVKPSVALQSDTYTNNVEQLAQNAAFIPSFLREEENSGYNTGFLGEKHLDIEDCSYQIEEILDSSEDLYAKVDELDLESEYNLKELPDEDETQFNIRDGYEESLDAYKVLEEQDPESNLTMDFRSYAEKNLKSELEKGVKESDLDRVEKLAKEVYKE